MPVEEPSTASIADIRELICAKQKDRLAGVFLKSVRCAQGTRFDMAVTDIAGRSAASAMARPRPLAMQE